MHQPLHLFFVKSLVGCGCRVYPNQNPHRSVQKTDLTQHLASHRHLILVVLMLPQTGAKLFSVVFFSPSISLWFSIRPSLCLFTVRPQWSSLAKVMYSQHPKTFIDL